MEVKNSDSTGEPDTTTAVQPVWDAHSGSEAGISHSDGQVKKVHVDMDVLEVCVNIS